MKFVLALCLMVLWAGPLQAQSTMKTPPPQVAPTPRIMDSMPRTQARLTRIFSDLEKKIIRDVLGTTQPTSQSGDDAEKDNEDDDDKNKKKRKKHKSKHKGGKKGKGMPPGLAKRDKLPPGLQRQLERNGKLPPGLQKKALPDDLEAKLPPAIEGTERKIVGNDVVLIDVATDIVLDVIRNVMLK